MSLIGAIEEICRRVSLFVFFVAVVVFHRTRRLFWSLIQDLSLKIRGVALKPYNEGDALGLFLEVEASFCLCFRKLPLKNVQ